MAACKNGESFPSDFFNQPWIIQCHGGNKHTTTFIDPMKTNVEEKEIGEIKGKLCFGCIDEWLFLWDKQSKECFFLELNSLSKVHLPPLPREFSIMNLQLFPREYSIMTAFSLSSYPNHPDCMVIFTGEKIDRRTPFTEEVTEFFVMYCRPHDEKWTKLPLYEPSKKKKKLPLHGVEDEDEQLITGETCVILNNKLYTYSVFHVIVFDIPSLLAGQIDMRTIKAPMHTIYPLTDMVSTHLVESCGHVYLVRMYNYERGPIINMDIYCLDTSSDKWSRVDSIGERAFFLSHKCYTSVCAMDAGVSCNCIYYVPCSDEDERRIYKFCLDDNTMTFRSISIEHTEHESRFCWFVPRRTRKMIRDFSVSPTIVLNEDSDYKVLTEEKITRNTSRPWTDLPMRLFELLPQHMSLVDSVRLFAVCKAWNLTSDSIPKEKIWPWLLCQEKLDDTYKLLEPLNGEEYRTKIGLPSSVCPTQMLCSKDGWVVVHGGDHAMFMVNPMIQHVVKLPALTVFDEKFHGITFTSVPTSPDCIVIGLFTDKIDLEIHVWHFGEEEWTFIFGDKIEFNIANTNPVFHHGELYFLGEYGELGVFNPIEQTWDILINYTELVCLEGDSYFRGTHDRFLLELGEDLISVFKYNYLDYEMRIFKLDKVKIEWIELEDLAGWTLFLDPRSSFAKLSPNKSCSNKIFFTTIYSGTTKSTCASYCMESKRYEMNFCDTRKPLECVWLEPNLITKGLMDDKLS